MTAAGSSPRVRLLRRLVMVPLLAFGMIFYLVLLPSQYDPIWWISAGHGDVMASKAFKANSPENYNSDGSKKAAAWAALLLKDVHYRADFDVASIAKRIPPNGPSNADALNRSNAVPKNWKPKQFEYVNETTSPFGFVWVSLKPRVAYIPEFLTDEECELLIARASSSLERSLVIPVKGAPDVNDVRSSTQTWLPVTYGIGRTIADRVFMLTGFPHGTSEHLQILHYTVGQKYDAHHDYFDPKLYGPQATNRAATLFLYLNTVEAGGETWFPYAMRESQPPGVRDCTGGLAVRPTKRSAVLFYGMTPTGEFDPWSLHGGCPVKVGQKWGGTLWLRVSGPS